MRSAEPLMNNDKAGTCGIAGDEAALNGAVGNTADGGAFSDMGSAVSEDGIFSDRGSAASEDGIFSGRGDTAAAGCDMNGTGRKSCGTQPPQIMINKQLGKGALWNIIGSSLYALVSMILGTLVIRVLGGDMGGIFFFAFSTLGQHIYVISYFGMRAIHSTDTGAAYTFGEYRRLRVWTAAAGLAAGALAAVIYSEFSYKAAVIIIVAAYRVLDGYADIYECEMQRDGRLDLTGRSMTFRTLLVMAVFLTVMLTTKDLVLSSVSLVAAIAGAIFIYDIPRLRKLGGGRRSDGETLLQTPDAVPGQSSSGTDTEGNISEREAKAASDEVPADYNVRPGKVRKLFEESVWLFAAVFLDFLVFAASKYAVDAGLPSVMSGYYSTLFVPASVMQLFANFVVRPLLPGMSEAYLGGDRAKLKKMLTVCTLVIGVAALIAAVAAYFIGVPVLCIFAGREAYETMIDYRSALALIVIAGGIYAMATPIYYALVIGRLQKKIFWIYLAIAGIAFVLAFVMVGYMGLAGGAWSMVISLALLFIGFYITAARGLWSRK